MNIINFNTPIPHLTKDMIDFSNMDFDESCGEPSITFPLILNDVRFDELIKLFHDTIRQEYYPQNYEVEQEFEDSLNPNIDLVITMNNYGNYEFTLFNCTDDGEIYAKYQVDLCDREIELFQPYMYKYFESAYQLEQTRENVVITLDTVIPDIIKSKFRLVSDSISGNRYRSAWISSDNKYSAVCELDDYTDANCPVKIVKFGF